MFKRKGNKGHKSLQSSPSKENPNINNHEGGGGGGFFSSSLPKNIFSGRSRKSSGGSSKGNKMSPSHNANVSPSHVNVSQGTTGQPPDYSPYRQGQGYVMHDGYSTQPRMTTSVGSGKPFFESSPSNTNHGNVANIRDRYEFEHGPVMVSDQALERQFERLTGNMSSYNDPSKQMHGREWHTLSSSLIRDKSIDREYPHMGARSLERDHNNHVGRSQSSERPDYTTQLYNSQEMRGFRDGLILELQSQIADLNKDCAKLQQEVDSYKDKLSSSMNSIKTFWSPELKKERALRKEENAKYCLMNEQLKVAQAELQVR